MYMIWNLLRALSIIAAMALPAQAAGVIPFALTQQIDVNGRPIVGCKLNIYVVGTTATLQSIFSDFGLSLPLPNPLTCDATGRLPSFYLADGQVHVNLTDPGGLVLIDIPVLQVVGPSSGGGGGGSVDPNSILSTGDFKWRPTAEILGGWVKANGQTIGSATSGASGRANSDTQALFVHIWINCPNAHCPVSSGRGASGLADFNANKTIATYDMRGRQPTGRDQMEAATFAGRINPANITSGGGDGTDTPNASGGEASHTQTLSELVQHFHANTINNPAHSHSVTDPSHVHSVSDPSHTHGLSDPGHAHGVSDPTHTHGITDPAHVHSTSDPGHAHSSGVVSGLTATSTVGSVQGAAGGATGAAVTSLGINAAVTGIGINSAVTNISIIGAFTGMGISAAFTGVVVNAAVTGIGVNATTTAVSINNTSTGSSTPFNVMDPFMLGTWYVRL